MEESILKGFLVLLGVSGGFGFSTGPPQSTCLTMFPKHMAESQRGPSPFTIDLSSTNYRPLQNITVTIYHKNAGRFKGIQVGAHRFLGNTEEILGKFVGAEPESKLKYMKCFGDVQNMVAHKNSADVKNVTIIWESPAEYVGDVRFTATILQSYQTFWAYATSPVLRALNATAAAPEFEEPSTEPRQIKFDSCAKSKGCFLYPRGCTGSDCKVGVTYQYVADGEYKFELFAEAKNYVSLGFSDDKKMGDDHTITCTIRDTRVSVQNGYNPKLYNERQYRGELKNLYVRKEDGLIYCEFTRPSKMKIISSSIEDAKLQVNDIVFDAEKERYLMIAWGQTYIDSDVIRKHTKLPVVSEVKVKLSEAKFIAGSVLPVKTKVHAVLGLFAWILFAGVGTVIARHYRDGFKGKLLFGVKVWFQIHRAVMIFTGVLAIISFIIIFIEVGKFTSVGFIHGIIGVITTALAVLQIIGGFLRPTPDSRFRPIFNLLHRLQGKAAHVLAAVAIMLAFSIPIMPDTAKFQGTIVIAVWIGFQILWEVSLEIWKYLRAPTKRNSYAVSDSSGSKFEIADQSSEDNSRNGAILLVVYVLVLVSLVIAAVVIVVLI